MAKSTDSKKDKKVYPLKGTIYWAHTNREDPDFKGYNITLGNLSKDVVEALKGMGINVNNKPEFGDYLKFKSKFPIKTFMDDTNEEIDPEILIGNGSKGKVKFYVDEYYHQKLKKKMNSVRAVSVFITELNEFIPDSGPDDLVDALKKDKGEPEIRKGSNNQEPDDSVFEAA
jgi:hypothetical protein